MLYLDYLAYHNTLRHVSVGEKLLLGGGALLLALLLPRSAVLITVAVVMHLVMLYAHIPLPYLLRLWMAPVAFLVAGLVSVTVSVSAEPFAALITLSVGGYYLGVTQQGLAVAGELFLRSVAAVSCLFMLATTTPVAYMAAFLARIPILRNISEIALLAYRFIFVFLGVAAQIYTAQQSRLGYSSPRKTLSSLAFLAANVGRKTFLTARDLHLALAARNYRDRLNHYYPTQRVTPARLAVIAALLAGMALTAWL